MDDLPGYEFAKEHGYSLYAYGGDKRSVYYHKGRVELKIRCHVNGELYAELSTVIGLVTCSTGEFSFPHKHFNNFEFQIERLARIDESHE
jgi:hypothetical protein